MSDIDRVVGALLSAVGTLETMLELDSHAFVAANALEEVAHRLGEMEPEERRDFDAALARLADAYDASEPGTGDRVREAPARLGLT